MICPFCQRKMILCDVYEDVMYDMTCFECRADRNNDYTHYSVYYGDSAWWVEDYDNNIEIGCETLHGGSTPVFSNYIVIRSPNKIPGKIIRPIDPFFFNKANNVLQSIMKMKAFL